MTRSAIIESVKARLDELSQFDAIEINSSISLIDKLIDESTESVLLIYPLHLLSANTITGEITINTDLSAKMPLSDDFLRLAAFKLSSWDHAVYKVITPEHPAYQLQKNKYTRGGVISPVIVLADRELQIYSAASGDTCDIKKYIKRVVVETITDTTLLNVISWQCAADVLAATGQLNILPIVKEKIKELLYVRN